MAPSHGSKVVVMGAVSRTGSHLQRQKIFVARGFPAAPGMPRVDPSVMDTVASGKNVGFKIGHPQFQRDFFLFSVVAKKRKSLPPPPSETDRKAVGISEALFKNE